MLNPPPDDRLHVKIYDGGLNVYQIQEAVIPRPSALGGMLLFRFLANRRQSTSGRRRRRAGRRSATRSRCAARSRSADAPCERPWRLRLTARHMPPARPANARNANDEVGITDGDLDTFERLLTDVQGAFGREDYAALRQGTTPEIMSYLSEELSQNATSGGSATT